MYIYACIRRVKLCNFFKEFLFALQTVQCKVTVLAHWEFVCFGGFCIKPQWLRLKCWLSFYVPVFSKWQGLSALVEKLTLSSPVLNTIPTSSPQPLQGAEVSSTPDVTTKPLALPPPLELPQVCGDGQTLCWGSLVTGAKYMWCSFSSGYWLVRSFVDFFDKCLYGLWIKSITLLSPDSKLPIHFSFLYAVGC